MASCGVKHDWYQTESDIVVAVMVKGTSKESCQVYFGDRGHVLSVKVKDSESEEFKECLFVDLFRYIDPAQSSFRCFPSKIEVKMRKAEGGRWEKLESASGTPGGAQAVSSSTLPASQGNRSNEGNIQDLAHTYPTSSTKGPKNWDKIEKEVMKEDEEEKKSGDAAVNSLFQQIYRDADEDVKRAMMKSFQESNGTVLSTNWAEVGKDKVECKPPDGMEWKKY